MSGPSNIREEAKSAAQSGNYEKAAELYGGLWHSEDPNVWDARGLANALRKSNQYEDALQVCRAALSKEPGFGPVASEFSWVFWQLHIKQAKKPVTRSLVDEFLEVRNSVDDPYDKYSAFSRALLDLSKIELEANNPSLALEYAEHLDSAKLDPSTNLYNDKTLPGPRQSYYTIVGKALKADSNWHRLQKLSSDVRNDRQIRWANKGDSFIARWGIEARFHLGLIDDAIKLTKELLSRMDEWYVRADLAKYLAAGGHSKEALLESLKAAKAHGPFEFKVNLFKQIASQLIAVERSESAAPFLQANICIRDGKGWPKDDEVWSMANQLSVDLDGPSLPNVERQVKSTLDVLLEEFDPLLPGVIKTVLPNGKSGFLTDSSGSDRFFGVRDLKIRPSELSAGLKVRFRPTTSFDKKKNCQSPAATNIILDDG